jgi:competence protein ComEC
MKHHCSHTLIALAVTACIVLLCCSSGCTEFGDIPFGSLTSPHYEVTPSITPVQSLSIPPEGMVVHFIDVEQGDAILIQCNGTNTLIDAGERNMGGRVVSYLRSRNVTSLDLVVATHPHSDHIGGMAEVLNAFSVGRFIDSGTPHTSKTYENMLTLIDEKNIPFQVAQRGQLIALNPAFRVEVLNPAAERHGDINEDSVVLRVTTGSIAFLLTGDAGMKAENEILAAGNNVRSDVLKVGHHGSRYASGALFLTNVSPAISIIQVGAGNEYGHPTEDALQRLQAVRTTVYRTDEHGTVLVGTDGRTLQVQTGAGYVYTPTPAGTPSPVITSTPTPAGYAVVISDLNLTDEWVLVENQGSSPVAMAGWTITDEGNRHRYTFPSYTLGAGANVTLYTMNGTDTESELYWGLAKSVWGNDGDTATLWDANGNLIDNITR